MTTQELVFKVNRDIVVSLLEIQVVVEVIAVLFFTRVRLVDPKWLSMGFNKAV